MEGLGDPWNKAKMIRSLSILLLLLIAGVAIGQEICDNAIDDDGDGLIDINDDDCMCQSIISSSLIPNPSFEERTCCPMENERLDCANGWIQASPPTTDYVNTCGDYLGNTNIPAFAPLPFPDGDGAVGFRNGEFFSGNNYKEYVGACLTEKMISGTTYRIDFFVGFRNNVEGSKNIDIAIYASTKCSDLPFGTDKNAGCPIGNGDYYLLDVQNVTGNNEWVPVTFEFTVERDYEVLVLGPTCSPSLDFALDPYFYVDRLLLAESNQFGSPFQSIEGSVCAEDLILSFENNPDYSYQWYKEGIAILGETSPNLSLGASTHEEGIYTLIITTPDFCFTSQEFFLRIPPYYAQDTVTICEGDVYAVGSEMLTNSDYYEIDLIAEDGCDSILQLILNVNSHSSSMMEFDFCEGDTFSFHEIQAFSAGNYETIIPNEGGCDSTITIQLNEISVSTAFEIETEYNIDLGEVIDLVPGNLDASLVNFKWTNEDGDIVGNSSSLNDFLVTTSTNLKFQASDEFGCESEVEIRINVDEEDLKIFVPNIFSPNEDGINDEFLIFASDAFTQITVLSIFDRWGNLVYKNEGLSVEESRQTGWDGKIGRSDASPGVYTYIMVVEITDREISLAGDFSLIR